jgi:type II secretory pathway pseudopilin PulG
VTPLPTRRPPDASGVTLVELLAVFGVIAITVAVLVPTASRARGRVQTLRCAANLKQIAVATQLYAEDYHSPPPGDLPNALGDYLSSRSVFTCPADKGSTDSYSAFYVARGRAGSAQFVVGCPRHGNGDHGAVAFGKSHCASVVTASVAHNAQPVEAGEVVTGGELTFADGSRVTVAEGGDVGLLMSFSDRGVCHNVIFVPKTSFTMLRCEVTSGSLLEVATPAAIADAEGARFDLATGHEYDAGGNLQYVTGVQVYEGTVRLSDRNGRSSRDLPPGLVGKIKKNGRWAPDDPGNGKGKGKDKDKGK